VNKVLVNGYELVMTDMQMPRMDGLEATRKIRKLPNGKEIPILAMTANAFAEDREHCLAAGMNDFITKPVDPGALFATLLKWLPSRPVAETPPSSGIPVATAGDAALRASLERIDGLDMAQCLRALRNDVPGYVRLLRQFAKHHREDMEKIAGADPEAARRLAHTLQGAAATLGLTRLRESAAALETALRQDKPQAELTPLLGSCHGELEALNTALSGLAVEIGSSPAMRAEPARMQELMNRLESLLAQDDTAANELFAASHALLRPVLGETTDQLGRQIENFDYQAALASLKAARKHADNGQPASGGN